MRGTLLIRGGRLLSPGDGYYYEKKEILIREGLIAEIREHINVPADADVIQLDGETVSPGFIDIHGHFDMDSPLNIGLHPDVAGVRLGNCAVIDAGSTGAANFEQFHDKYMSNTMTRVYALLNLAYHGINTWSELSEEDNLRVDEMKEMIRKYPGTIVGVKVRSDGEAVGKLGLLPFQLGQKAARELKLPFVAHVGEYPPKVSEMIDLAQKGDLLTHCYNRYAPNGIHNSMVDSDGKVLDSVFMAKKRGVLFDVGHGGCSFCFQIAHAAFDQGFYPDMISTDIYAWNFLKPVWGLIHTMNKILHLGMNMEECVRCVTSVPADFFHLEGLGHLKEGNKGDITIFHMEDHPIELVDSKGRAETCRNRILADYVTVGGKAHRLL